MALANFRMLIHDLLNEDFSDSSWQDCPDTGRSTGAYNIFYQGGSIDHGTHVQGLISQSIAESEYNAECTTGMALAYFRMLIYELLNQGYRQSSRVISFDCLG